MLVDNFNQIKPWMDFSDPDLFYHIMILRRKKDNPEAAHAKLIKDVYIDNLAYMERKEGYIKDLCDFMNARAYINLNRRSYRKAALKQIGILADYIGSEQYTSAGTSYRKAVGKATKENRKLWVIDFDGDEVKNIPFTKEVIKALHEDMVPRADYTPTILPEVQTKNGIHLLTTPFNTRDFSGVCEIKKVTEPDVKKDNPTILYSP